MHAIHSSTLSHFRDHEKAGRVIPPKSVGSFKAAGTFSLPVLLDNVTGHDRGRGVLLIHDQRFEMSSVFGVVRALFRTSTGVRHIYL